MFREINSTQLKKVLPRGKGEIAHWIPVFSFLCEVLCGNMQ